MDGKGRHGDERRTLVVDLSNRQTILTVSLYQVLFPNKAHNDLQILHLKYQQDCDRHRSKLKSVVGPTAAKPIAFSIIIFHLSFISPSLQ